jgi:hypothetical protein
MNRDPQELPPTHEIRLSRRAVLVFAAVLTFVAGTLFSGAAAAAGIHSPDLLALIFALGGCGTLLFLVIAYLGQLVRQESRERARSKVDQRFIDRGSPWTQHRRPPSGSTIMWAANALRRRTGAASLR